MHFWFRWIFWINPEPYAFECFMENEMGNLNILCQEPQYAPYGNGYNNEFRCCTVVGSTGNIINGKTYIHKHYNYSSAYVWSQYWVVDSFRGNYYYWGEKMQTGAHASVFVLKRGSEEKHQKQNNCR